MLSDQLEKAQDEFNAFLSTREGLDSAGEIIEKYPAARILFVPAQQLPYVGEGKVWVCDCGCGERDPVIVPYALMAVFTPQGLQEARIQYGWTSPCLRRGYDNVRHHGMDLWDNETDDVADPHTRLEGT